MGVVISGVRVFLVVGFFAAHQLWSTGFFLPGFGAKIAALFRHVLIKRWERKVEKLYTRVAPIIDYGPN